jgi:hypothetical protein
LIKLRQEIFVRWITRRGSFLSLCGIAQGRAEGDYQIFRNPTLSAAAAGKKRERDDILTEEGPRENILGARFKSARGLLLHV